MGWVQETKEGSNRGLLAPQTHLIKQKNTNNYQGEYSLTLEDLGR